MIALGRQVAEEGTGTERQKENAKLWADAAKVTLSDPTRHGGKTPCNRQKPPLPEFSLSVLEKQRAR